MEMCIMKRWPRLPLTITDPMANLGMSMDRHTDRNTSTAPPVTTALTNTESS